MKERSEPDSIDVAGGLNEGVVPASLNMPGAGSGFCLISASTINGRSDVALSSGLSCIKAMALRKITIDFVDGRLGAPITPLRIEEQVGEKLEVGRSERDDVAVLCLDASVGEVADDVRAIGPERPGGRPLRPA